MELINDYKDYHRQIKVMKVMKIKEIYIFFKPSENDVPREGQRDVGGGVFG